MGRLIWAHENNADHQGQLYFQKTSWIKIMLTLMARLILAHEYQASAFCAKIKRTIRVSFILPMIFSANNKADPDGPLYLDPNGPLCFWPAKIKRAIRVSFIIRKYIRLTYQFLDLTSFSLHILRKAPNDVGTKKGERASTNPSVSCYVKCFAGLFSPCLGKTQFSI